MATPLKVVPSPLYPAEKSQEQGPEGANDAVEHPRQGGAKVGPHGEEHVAPLGRETRRTRRRVDPLGTG